jgi:hypothetical protein
MIGTTISAGKWGIEPAHYVSEDLFNIKAQNAFRNASIGSAEMTLWVRNRRADHWLS